MAPVGLGLKEPGCGVAPWWLALRDQNFSFCNGFSGLGSVRAYQHTCGGGTIIILIAQVKRNRTHQQTEEKRKLRQVTGLARGHASHRSWPCTTHTGGFDPNFQGEKIVVIF